MVSGAVDVLTFATVLAARLVTRRSVMLPSPSTRPPWRVISGVRVVVKFFWRNVPAFTKMPLLVLISPLSVTTKVPPMTLVSPV